MRLVGPLALGAAAVTLTAVAYANAAGPETTTATPAPPTTTVAPPTTTVMPQPTTTIAPPVVVSPFPTTTPSVFPARDGFYCGNGFRGYEVYADFVSCDMAHQVTDAYGAEYPRWVSGAMITVSVAGANWDCRQRSEHLDTYQECVTSERPFRRALLYSDIGFSGGETGSLGR
ncbi:hypothetical protein [Nocardia heshunensis]